MTVTDGENEQRAKGNVLISPAISRKSSCTVSAWHVKG